MKILNSTSLKTDHWGTAVDTFSQINIESFSLFWSVWIQVDVVLCPACRTALAWIVVACTLGILPKPEIGQVCCMLEARTNSHCIGPVGIHG